MNNIKLQIKKHVGYLRYIARHKYYVMIGCIKLGIPWRGILHDLSKFRPDEYIAYLEYFYGDHGTLNPKDKIYIDFRRAWVQHCHRNSHHWEHWVRVLVTPENNISIAVSEMDDMSLREMIADWHGAGMAIKGYNDLRNWYTENQKRIIVGPKTRIMIDYYISILKNI